MGLSFKPEIYFLAHCVRVAIFLRYTFATFARKLSPFHR
jgi:hypothetical protein